MHPDLSPHLHTTECNKLIREYKLCHKNHSFGKFFGCCNSIYDLMLKCMKQERIAKRQINFDKAKEKHRRLIEAGNLGD